MRRSLPPAEQVRGALNRVLASQTFARSERARELLRYLVEQQLAGRSDRLKGFAIAVDVFGKSASFDPSTDAVVRVQAGRLRELLEHYYAGEGAADPLRVMIARGSYVPDYEAVAVPEPEVTPAIVAVAPTPPANPAPPTLPSAVHPDVPARRGRASRSWRTMASALVAIMALAIVLGLQVLLGDRALEVRQVESEPGEVTGSVQRETLPSVSLRTTGDTRAVQRVADSLRRGLAGFDTIDFIGRDHPAAESSGGWTRFEINVLSDSRERDVLVEIHSAETGKVLLSRALPTDLEDATDDMVADLLTIAVPASGSIFAYLAEVRRQTPLVECLTLNDRFYRDQNATNHRAAYDCLDVLVEAGSLSPLVYSELASLHMQTIVGRYDYPPLPTEAEALAHARRAVALGPHSPYAHRAMGYVLQRIGKASEARQWMQKAYELNPYDLSMAASYAYGLIFAGDYAEGTPVMGRAVNAASAHPTWWDYGLFLGHFMLSEYQDAADAVGLLAASERAHYLAARLIAADLMGRERQALQLVEEIRVLHPAFAANPGATFERGNYPADMTEKLVSALLRAGLQGSS